MFCNNCGKKIEDGVAFCPACGKKQAAPRTAVPEKRICTMKEYYRDINSERISFFKKIGIVFSVICILLSVIFVALSLASLSKFSTFYEEASDNNEVLEKLIDDPHSLNRKDKEDIIDLLGLSEDELNELKDKYDDGELNNFEDVREFVTLDRAFIVFSGSYLGSYTNMVLNVLRISLVIMLVTAIFVSVIVIYAVVTNSRNASVWALTLASLILFTSCFIMLPVFILALVIDKMIAKNERLYQRYIERI